MAGISRAMAAKLKAFPRSAWVVSEIILAERDSDCLKPELRLELSAAGHTFKAIIRAHYDIELQIDGITVGGQWYSPGLEFPERLFNPQSQLGHHLWKMFREDIRTAVRLQRAQKALADHQNAVAYEAEQLAEQLRQQELVRNAEQALEL